MSRRKPLYLFAAGVFLISSVAAIAISSASPNTAELTQTASAVTYVSAQSQSTNFDNSPMLSASHISYRALLQFNTIIPAGSTVDSATLTLDSATAAGGVFSAYNVGPFDPTSVTWSNRPALDGAPLGSSTSGTGSQVIPLSGLDVEDVTDVAVTYSQPGLIAHLSGLPEQRPRARHRVHAAREQHHHHDRSGNHHDGIDHSAQQHLDDQPRRRPPFRPRVPRLRRPPRHRPRKAQVTRFW